MYASQLGLLACWVSFSWAQGLPNPPTPQVSSSPRFDYALYHEILPHISFPVYSPEQRTFVAQQVYVNADSKKYHYNVDAKEAIKPMLAQAASYSDYDFHVTMAKLFYSLRDFHTVYELPIPYSCYGVAYPLKLEFVESKDMVNDPIVIVKSFSAVPEIRALSSQVMSQVQIGDIVVAINGLSFKQMYNDFKSFTGGANHFGGYRSIINNFVGYRNGKTQPLPTETEITYTLKRRITDLETYTVTAPLIGVTKQGCVQKAAMTDQGTSTADASDLGESIGDPEKRPVSVKTELLTMSNAIVDGDRIFMPQASSMKTIRLDGLKDISWGIYAVDGGRRRLGIIRIDTFAPSGDDNGLLTVRRIRQLLVNEIKDTDALVFDVRNNAGGLITIADSLPQFFVTKPLFNTFQGRALVNPINHYLFTTTVLNATDWGQTYRRTPPTEKFTPLVKFDELEKSYFFGQAYFKPVGVLTNANCYSACDMFTANMKDIAGAVIFGEDPQTGAGGANVVDMNFLSRSYPDFFKKLPNSQNIRVGWRQTGKWMMLNAHLLVRTGLNAGKKIEDVGVAADYIVRPIPEDFYTNQTVLSQFEFIGKKLTEIGDKDGRSHLYFITDPQVRGDVEVGMPASLACKVSGFTKIEMYAGDKLVKKAELLKSDAITDYTLTSDHPSVAIGVEKYTLIGYVNDILAFTSFRYFRYIPVKSGYYVVQPGSTASWDFNPTSFSAVYNINTDYRQGWNHVNNRMVIGNGQTYVDNTDTMVSLFFNFMTGTSPSIRIRATYDTERNEDTLSATVSIRGMKTQSLFSVSGSGEVSETYFIEGGSGQDGVEVGVRFVSDGSITGGSVSILEMTVSG